MGKKLPKGITQRGSSFRVSIMVSGVRQSATCDTLIDAIQQAEAFRAGVGAQQVEKATPWTLQEAADALMAERVEVNATSRASIETRRSTLRVLVEFVGGEVSVDAIDYSAVMRLSKHLRVERDLSSSYTNQLLLSLKMLLDHAWRSGRKTEAPILIELVKQKSGRIRYLTREEEGVVIQWLDHHGQDDMIDLVRILIDTGLRIGELLALEWKDVDLAAQKIHVWKSKSAEPRAVAMTKRVQTILRSRCVRQQGSKVMGKLTYKKARAMWQQMRAGIGLAEDTNFVIHVLRHTCCTRLVSGGVDLRTVQLWMGHEDIQTTMRYAQFVPEKLIDAAAALEPSKPDLRVVKGG